MICACYELRNTLLWSCNLINLIIFHRCSDGGIFGESTLRRAIENGTLGLPDPDPLPNDNEPVHYFFIGDDAFPMRRWLMKGFPQRNIDMQRRIYNYRLSRARRVVENAFGILAHR